MRKDKYEISLWDDIVINASYTKTKDTQLVKTKNYYFYNSEEGTYSAGIKGETISLYKSFPKGNSEISWYKVNASGKKEKVSSSEILNTEISYYYLDKNGNYFEVPGATINLYTKTDWYEMTIPEHYEEEKIAVIGSESMTAQFKACEPKLVENINGTSTFTFKIFYTYIDTETGEKKDNPFIKLLVNERKIKVKWKNKWYNLIIKGIQEDMGGKSITYTCKDQFVNELSKTGFNLEFSNELMNNQGPINELAERVLKETDWKLKQTSDEIIRQTIEEPVYELYGKSVKAFEAKNVNGNIPIPAKAKILVYYSVYNNKSSFFQFHYAEEDFSCENNSMLVLNGESCWVEGVQWDNNKVKLNGQTLVEFSSQPKISLNYRAKRLVKQQLQEYDNLTKTYCNVYEDENGKKVYGYMGTRTTDATAVVNLLANNGSTGFTGSEGYSQAPNKNSIAMPFGLFPKLNETNIDDYLDGTIHSYLKFTHKDENTIGTTGEVRYLNRGISKNTQYLEDGFSAGEVYIFRYKAVKTNSKDNGIKLVNKKPDYFRPTDKNDTNNIPLIPRPGLYNNNTLGLIKNDNNKYIFAKSFVGTFEDENRANEYWVEWKITCKESISRSDILSNDFDFIFGVTKTFWLQEVQFFKEEYGKDINGNKIRLEPNSISGTMVAQPEYRYYYADDAKGISDKDKLKYLYKGLVDISEADGEVKDEEGNSYTPIPLEACYPENDFEKIRSIEAKQSNRFNILQTLAETFECYPKFEIANDPETGKIDYYKRNSNGVLTSKFIGPQKFVSFQETIGVDTGLKFIYGIDLKTISRTINSDQIVTKTIVLNNNNEVAKNGFCTIARANDNLSKANFILNFDYYISHGLIDGDKLILDLYDTSEGSLGYYQALRKLNTAYDDKAQEKALKQTEFDKLEAQLEVYKGYVEESEEEIISIKTKLKTLTNKSFTSSKRAQSYGESKDFQEVKDLALTWTNLSNNIKAYNTIIDSLEKILYNSDKNYICIEEVIKTREKEIDNPDWETNKEEPGIKQQIEQLDKLFYEKYSRYIQEGSWTSDQYMDDNLYYLDAQSVAYTSSRPQVQYNISVLRLSALDEFKNKVFNLGDIATIQDTEFFGYKWVNNVKTPYQEQVLISEITSNFESPENDSLKIQNYKTQFEDLFQRITATTQSLQYAAGEYKKAANLVESDGTIKASVLQNSLDVNNSIAIHYQNNAITTDATGITVTDISNPNRKVKITSGGILFTNGSGWRTGIDADGIRADYLTAGSINTNNIMIYSGDYPTFRWTSSGLDAYSFGDAGVNFNKFVRFDQYGIYGVQNLIVEEGKIWKPINEDDVKKKASFGMTWNGFFMKNRDGSGWVEVSSDNDIAVFKTITENEVSRDTEKIKIGRLEQRGNSYLYGLRISDDSGAIVMETNEDGQLWLRDKLRVETYDKGEVQIGKLDTGATGKHGGRVIAALEKSNATEELKNKFIVYEDGHLEANGVTIEGTINATGGTIGTLSVFDIEEALGAKKLKIDSDGGTFFINNSPLEMVLTAEVLTKGTATDWKWYFLEGENKTEITEYSNSQTCIVKASDIGLGKVKIYVVEATIVEEVTNDAGETTIVSKTHSAQIVLNHMALDVDLDLYSLETSQQEILKFLGAKDEKIVLTPQFFKFVPKKGKINLNNNDYYFVISVDENEIGSKYHHWGEYITTNKWSEGNTYYLNEEGRYILIETEPNENSNIDQMYLLSNEECYIVNINSFYSDKGEDFGLNNKEYSLLKIDLYNNDSEEKITSFYYSITFGTSEDLASFSIYSTGISAAIQNTSLEFNTEGLTIYNGGLKIIGKDPITKEEDTLFYYQEPSDDTDDASGGLIIKGSGTFTGSVYANKGEFAGTIKSSSGEIAGLIMEEIPVRQKYHYEIAETNEQKELSEKKEKTDIIEIEVLESHSILHDEQNNLYINGTTGAIETNNILIKSGARIESYLQLGNGFIKNPEWNQNEDRVFISTEKDGKVTFSLNDSGVINMGKISINGNTSLLKLGDEEQTNIVLDGEESVIYGNKWNITPEVASFNKVNITNGIFETGKIQSIGGSMIFKSGARIKKWLDKTKFQIDGNINLNSGDWIKISDSEASSWGAENSDIDVQITAYQKYYGVSNEIKENFETTEFSEKGENSNWTFYENIVCLSKEISNISYDTVTYLCSTDEKGELYNNVLIGVNANDALAENLAPRAFSFIEITKKNNQLVYLSPKLIIGDLSAAKQSQAEYYKKIEGYGLYGENVYLNGTLTTKVGNDSYAGVNTISGVHATKFKDYEESNDESKIVFWAGAKMDSNSDESESISQAPFQVTEAGSIYASQGIFEGTLITKSTIEGSTIRAAKLYGWQVADAEGNITQQEAALKIYNTDNSLGIEFRQETNESDIKTLSLNTNGFIVYDYSNEHSKNFIDFNLDESSFGVDGYFNNMYLDYLLVDNIKIDNHKITYLADDKTTEYGYLKFKVGENKQQGWSLGIYEQEEEKEILYYDSTSKKTLNSIDFQVTENVVFGSENNGKMEYKKILDNQNKIIGYDLYIS